MYCYEHRLNLVLAHGAKSVPASNCKTFFSNLWGFSTYLAHSTKRSVILNKYVTCHIPSHVSTRWSYDARIVEVIFTHREELIQALQAIEDDPFMDGDSEREAGALLSKLEEFEFMFLFHTYQKVWLYTNLI